MCARASMLLPSRTATGSHSLDQAHAFDGDAVGHRMIERRAIRFEIVRQRVHADRRGDVRRQAERQLRIGDHQRRLHLRMEDDLLGVIAQVGDDRGAPDFRAGARRRRHADGRRDAGDVHARVPVLAILEIPDRTRLPDHQRDRLAGVERAAAAERDDAVVRAAPVGRDAVRDVRFDRIRLHVARTLRTPRPALATAQSTALAIIGSAARPGSVTSSGRVDAAASCTHRAARRCVPRRSGSRSDSSSCRARWS